MHITMRLLIILSSFLLYVSNAEHPTKISFKCFDKDCSQPIGIFYSNIDYPADSIDKISYRKNDVISIFGYPSDESLPYFLVNENGKLKFVYKYHLRRNKEITKPTEDVLVDVPREISHSKKGGYESENDQVTLDQNIKIMNDNLSTLSNESGHDNDSMVNVNVTESTEHDHSIVGSNTTTDENYSVHSQSTLSNESGHDNVSMVNVNVTESTEHDHSIVGSNTTADENYTVHSQNVDEDKKLPTMQQTSNESNISGKVDNTNLSQKDENLPIEQNENTYSSEKLAHTNQIQSEVNSTNYEKNVEPSAMLNVTEYNNESKNINAPEKNVATDSTTSEMNIGSNDELNPMQQIEDATSIPVPEETSTEVEISLPVSDNTNLSSNTDEIMNNVSKEESDLSSTSAVETFADNRHNNLQYSGTYSNFQSPHRYSNDNDDDKSVASISEQTTSYFENNQSDVSDIPLNDMKENIDTSMNSETSSDSLIGEKEDEIVVDTSKFNNTEDDSINVLYYYMPNIFLTIKNMFSSEEQYCFSENDNKDNCYGTTSNNLSHGWTLREHEWAVPSLASALMGLVFLIVMKMFNRKSKGEVQELVGLINHLQGKILVASKEIISLQENIESYKAKSTGTEDSEKLATVKKALDKQLRHYQTENTKLTDKVTYLENELESVSTSALEMHKLLETSLSTQNSRATADEIDELRSTIEKQESDMEELRRNMNIAISENQMLKNTGKKMEKECNDLLKKNLELSEKQKELKMKLEKEQEDSSTKECELLLDIRQLKYKNENLDIELKGSQNYVTALKRVLEEKNVNNVTENDNLQLKSQLYSIEATNRELDALLKDEKKIRTEVEEQLVGFSKELTACKKQFDECQKNKNEAETKVQVLTDFFKTEISKLQKDLELKEKQFAVNEDRDQLISQQIQSCKEEVKNIKAQNTALKKEILDQEISFKAQLANAEQKCQDHWFAYRQSDRKYKEAQQEAANLRKKITILEEQNTGANESTNEFSGNFLHMPSVMENEFDTTFASPPPPLPISSNNVPEYFIPPEPLYPTDERLPPIGNSSFSYEDDTIPPPPLPIYHSDINYGTPPPPIRQKLLKKKTYKKSTGSPSSGISMESLDRSGR